MEVVRSVTKKFQWTNPIEGLARSECPFEILMYCLACAGVDEFLPGTKRCSRPCWQRTIGQLEKRSMSPGTRLPPHQKGLPLRMALNGQRTGCWRWVHSLAAGEGGTSEFDQSGRKKVSRRVVEGGRLDRRCIMPRRISSARRCAPFSETKPAASS